MIKKKKLDPARHIIHSARNVPILVRIRDIALTIVVWAMYLFFMKETFVFIRDVISWAVHGFGDTSAFPSFQIAGTMLSYIEAIIVMEILFTTWSLYNILRFGKKTRRRAPTPVSADNLATFYRLHPDDVRIWQKSQTLVMHHNKDGHLTDVERQS